MSSRTTGVILDDASRDELAVKNLDLVGRVVGRLPISVPRELDVEDLISVGTMGLLKAARTYQPMRGASFRTYAYVAIRAAVLDELRRFDPMPRGMRGRLRELRQAEEGFRARQGRLPTPDELADLLSLDASETSQLLASAEEERLLKGAAASDAAMEPYDMVDSTSAEPADQAARREELVLVEAAITALPERERQVMVLYFSEGLYLREIGELLGVTESRICQILACAERKVRVKLDALKEDCDA